MCLQPALLSGWAAASGVAFLGMPSLPPSPLVLFVPRRNTQVPQTQNMLTEHTVTPKVYPQGSPQTRWNTRLHFLERQGSGGADVDPFWSTCSVYNPEMLSLLQALPGPERHNTGLWLVCSAWVGSLPGAAQLASVGRVASLCPL